MKRVILFTLVLLTVLGAVFAADPVNAVTITVASMVMEPARVTPSISIGFAATGFSYMASTTENATLITDLDLTRDGSFTFSLLTTEEVNILALNSRTTLFIEIEADGFHLYEDVDPTSKEGFALAGATVLEKDAVPITSLEPDINIPGFSGSDENVAVEHTGGKNNKIEVVFNPGKTRAELVLGTFHVDWKGKRILDPGLYKAEVKVSYSTL